MERIVLASGSPRRQELLGRMGITDFDIRVPEVEERYPENRAVHLPGKVRRGGPAVQGG